MNYSSKLTRAKQTQAYSKAEELAIQQVDLLKTPITGTQFAQLVGRLNIEIKDLVN